MRAAITTIAFIVMLGLFVYPILFVVFPWTVPAPYMLAFVGSVVLFFGGLAHRE
jgi:hypothetical protein